MELCTLVIQAAMVGAIAQSHPPERRLELDLTLAQLDQPSSDETDEEMPRETAQSVMRDDVVFYEPFGRAGSEWITIGAGHAWNFRRDKDTNIHATYSNFLGDGFEFGVELGGWYFDQPGDDAFGINGNMIFRWHLWHDEAYDWTVYGDIGIGLLFATDNVPDGGTGFDFTPRAGFGYTKRLNDNGLRLQIGARWHHISNGRIAGNARNPSRDSIMGYIGIQFPF